MEQPWKMMRVVVCEPGKPAEVREVPHTLEAMQALVGGSIEYVPVLGSYDMWLNDEGRLIPLEPNRLVSAGAKLLHSAEGYFLALTEPGGRAWDMLGTVFVAKSNEDGDTVGLDDEEAQVIAELLTGSTPVCRPLRAEEVQEASIQVEFLSTGDDP